MKSVALNGVFLAVLSHGLIGLSLVWDKVLLKRRETQNLLSYVFWLGAISVFGLVLIAFGFRFPSLKLAGMAFAAGVLDLIGSFFYYSALKSGEVSEEVAVVGGFGPVATALLAIPFLKSPIGGSLPGFMILTAGGFVMFFAEKAPLKKIIPKVVLAAGCFGLMNVLQKVVFNHTNFVSGYVFVTLGTFIGALALIVPPSWRRQVFQHSEEAPRRSKFWYMFNRFIAGIGSFLVVFAISRASPSIVEAIAGVRYMIVFVGAYLITRFRPSWFKEQFRGPALTTKIAATCLVIAGVVVIAVQGGGAQNGAP
jgi:uncharacterized membrane protein